jgi:hypothetical protein
MPGIPPKCLECGADLRYDPLNLMYGCSACRPGEKPAGEKARESLKEAA